MNKIIIVLAFVIVGCAKPTPPTVSTNHGICKEMRYLLTEIMSKEVAPFLQPAHKELSNSMSHQQFWDMAIAVSSSNPLVDGYTQQERDTEIAELKVCKKT